MWRGAQFIASKPPLERSHLFGSGVETIPDGYANLLIVVNAGGGAGSGSNSGAFRGAGGGGSQAVTVLNIGGQNGKTLNWSVGAGGLGVNLGTGNPGVASTVTSGTLAITAMGTTGGHGATYGTGANGAVGAGGAVGTGGNISNTAGSAGVLQTGGASPSDPTPGAPLFGSGFGGNGVPGAAAGQNGVSGGISFYYF